jgi:hypothetical protein
MVGVAAVLGAVPTAKASAATTRTARLGMYFAVVCQQAVGFQGVYSQSFDSFSRTRHHTFE